MRIKAKIVVFMAVLERQQKRGQKTEDTSDFFESREEETGNRKYGTIRCIRSLIVGEVLN